MKSGTCRWSFAGARGMAMALAWVLAVQDVAAAEPALVRARQGMVVSVSAAASDAGLAVLARGGNAVDAAVATALALAVTFPEAGNIGGGGFMMIYPGAGQSPTCIEYRETAPAAARQDTFARDTDLHGHRTVGVPGTVHGLHTAHQRFGKLKWSDVVAPAVRLAREGFALEAVLARDLNREVADGERYPELRRVYGKPGGGEWRKGDVLKLPDLARTLQLIADHGPAAFYEGPIAEQIVAEMRAGGGLIAAGDLLDYRSVERQPVHGTYRGYDIYSSPPPSGGGTLLVEMLNVLENFDLRGQGRWSPETVHLVAETMKRAYADRARYLGDPQFTDIPSHLTTKEHARQLADSIDRQRATPSAQLTPEITLAAEGESTTHFSVVDGEGMAVSNTYTLQDSYGSRVVVRGAGFILNNEMTDFNWRPGYTDRQGKIGTAPNLVAPGKRMLSSQTPTFVFRDGKLVLVTGSPGGRTIPNTVLCVVLNVLEFGMDARQAVDEPRLHHQWLPDVLRVEGPREAPPTPLVERLRAMGHDVKYPGPRQGDAHTIQIVDGELRGAADMRRFEAKAAGR